MSEDTAYSTLANIRTKVRRLTRSPSTSQISDSEIDNYVNTFILYDFPEHLRLFSLRKVLTFYCDPYIDVYKTNTTDPNNPLYNFQNQYTTVHGPAYIAGYQALLSQSREQFFAMYPMVNSIQSIGSVGDGITTSFSGTLAGVPVVRNNVTFSSIDNNNGGLEAHDDGNGLLYGDVSSPGTIDYVTGAYTLNWTLAPQSGAAINSQTVPYVAALPQAILYYENQFTLRPIPDQPYQITLEAYERPTALLSANQSPDLCEWWQYIAYGAAKKVLEDRMDMETVQLIMPEFKQQERLILRRTLVQNSNQRVSTIYVEQTGNASGLNSWGMGNGGTI